VSTVQTTLYSTLTTKFQVPESEIVPSVSLGALGLDSLSLVELALILQEQLGVDVEEHETAKDTTVAQLTDVLTAKRALSAAAAAAAAVQ
jgi:acyl carrier protein